MTLDRYRYQLNCFAYTLL